MKILVCGKGGAGKSAVTLLMARALMKRGPVYILDSDESNRLLPKLMGTETPDTIANYLGGRKSISEGLNRLENVHFRSLPEEYVKRSPEGIGLTSVGKIEELGEGCACPFGLLSKVLLRKIALEDNETILVDTEAGVEHLGRSIEESIDALVVIVDPTAEGVAIAELLRDESERIGKSFHLILNKVTPEVEEIMLQKIMEKDLVASGIVRYDPVIFKSGLEGGRLQSSSAQNEVNSFVNTFF